MKLYSSPIFNQTPQLSAQKQSNSQKCPLSAGDSFTCSKSSASEQKSSLRLSFKGLFDFGKGGEDKKYDELIKPYCEDDNGVFNKNMFNFFKLWTEKTDFFQTAPLMQSTKNTMLKPDGEFDTAAIKAGIELFNTGRFTLDHVNDAIREIVDVRGDSDNELLSNLTCKLPEYLSEENLVNFLNARTQSSKNSKGQYVKEAYELFNNLYHKAPKRDDLYNSVKTAYISDFVKLCNSSDKFNTQLGECLLDNADIFKNYAFYSAMARIIKSHLINNNEKGKSEAIDLFTKLKKKDYSLDQIQEILNTVKCAGNTYPDEVYEDFKLLMKYTKDGKRTVNIISNCKDKNLVFKPELFDYAKKMVEIYTNKGKKKLNQPEANEIEYHLLFAKTDDKSRIDKNKVNVINEVGYIGGNHSERMEILEALGENHLEENFIQFKKYFKEGDNITNFGLVFGSCADKNEKFIPEKFERFQRIKQEAYNRRTDLRYGDDDISNEDIEKSFVGYADHIVKTADLLGEKGTEYLFNYKLDGFEEYVEKISEFSDKLSSVNPQRKEAILHLISPSSTLIDTQRSAEISQLKKEIRDSKTPEQTAKEEQNNKKIKEAEKEISVLKHQLENTIKNEDKENLKSKIKGKMREINSLNAEKRSFISNPELMKKINELENARKEYSKAEIRDFHNKIQAINILSAIDIDSNDFYLLYPYLDPKTESEHKVLKQQLNKLVFKFLNLEYDKTTSEQLNLVSGKYLSNIFGANDDFKDSFRDLVTVLKNNRGKTTKEALNGLESNQETKRQFTENGINYDKWATADKNSYLNVRIETDIEKAKQNAIKNLEADLNDPLFNYLGNYTRYDLFRALENAGINVIEKDATVYTGDGFANSTTRVKRLYYNGEPIQFKMLPAALKAIKKEMSQNEFWTKELDEGRLKNARDTIYTHIIKMRIPEADKVLQMKSSEIADLEVHKTDMNNISHSLFLGNHANCCTAVENDNGWSAPNYIKHKLISGIEVMNGNEFVGNTMCYFAKVDDKLALVLDNIELKAKYQYNDNIRDTIIKYAQKLAQEAGKQNIHIYAGPNRHKVDLSRYRSEICNLQIIGSTGNDEIYLDYDAEGHSIDGTSSNDIKLYRLR